MKKKLYLVICILSLTKTLGAQKRLPGLGEVDMKDLQMRTCSFEPGAAALKLFDVEETQFDINSSGTRIKIEHHTRIKIFNEQGYQYASIHIPFLSKRGIGKIKELNGVVYNLDPGGKIVVQKLEKKDFFKEKAIENVGIVNFTFPNLRPGSIIEFSYTRIERDLINIDPWVIQSEIPTAYSSVIVTTPASSQLREKLFGSDSVDKKTELLRFDQYRRITYSKENIPAFKPEPFMSSEKDNLMKMIFFHFPRSNYMLNSIAASNAVWKMVGEYMLESESFGGQIKKKIPGSEKLLDSAGKITEIPDRIRFIYEAVRKKFPAVSDQTLNTGDIVEAWKENSATSGEINLVLLNLLTKAGITCYPLLVSTRNNGLISKDFPSFSQLNGIDVVAVTDSAHYFLMDASLKFQPPEFPPFNVINREALLLNPANIDWFMVSDKRSLIKQGISVFCEVREDGIAEGEATLQHSYYAKSYLLDSTLDAQDRENKFFDKNTLGLKILSDKRENILNDAEPLFQSISFTYELPHTDNFYFIDPGFLAAKKENPFKAAIRRTDIDLVCNQEIITSLELSFPSSFEIDHLPGNLSVRAADSSFHFRRTFSGDSSHIFMTEIYQITRPIFSKEEYSSVQDFFKRMYALRGEEIILKKKK
jgi:hypothetical protein